MRVSHHQIKVGIVVRPMVLMADRLLASQPGTVGVVVISQWFMTCLQSRKELQSMLAVQGLGSDMTVKSPSGQIHHLLC